MIGHKDFTVRYATREDLLAFYGGPHRTSARAVVAEHGGEVVAVAGVMIEPGRTVAFSDVRPELHYSPRAALRMAREALALTARAGTLAWTRTDNHKFLKVLGFEHLGPAGEYQEFAWKQH